MKRQLKDNILFQPIKVKSYSTFFAELAKALVHLSTGQFNEAYARAIDAIAEVKIGDTDGRLAWDLVNRAVVRAIADLVGSNQNSIPQSKVDFSIEGKIKNLDYDREIKIDFAFFKHPKESLFVKDIQEFLLEWLALLCVEKHKAAAIVERFPALFVCSLHNEWGDNPEKYQRLLNNTPFSEVAIAEEEWDRYKAYLEQQTQEGVFGDFFSLSQIFVPLCAYCKVDQENEEKKYVVDLKDAICEWLDQNDKNDSIRMISGGPGSGKSSFVKMLAVDIFYKHKVLFFQLHRLGINDDIEKSIERFLVANGFFTRTPIGNENPLLIIFDGLDELTLQGNAGSEAARGFVNNIDNQLLKNYNAKKLQHRIILTGRDLPIQDIESKFEKKQILHVLPYCLKPISFKEIMDYEKYVDTKHLLDEDKRDLWWGKYGTLTRKGYEKLPDILNGDALIDITSQPLLNYLLAINYDPAQESTPWDNLNRNKLYDILFENVYRRVWESEGHNTAERMGKLDFEAILEEIAISAWQGGESRTTTVKAINERCKKCQMESLLTSFQKNAEDNVEKGILNLLVAFYFRQFDAHGFDKTFEFTHKSFSEYLIAKKIIRQLHNTVTMLEQQRTKNDGWTEETALVNWIELCGKMPLDADIHVFLCDEMKQRNNIEVEEWQNMLCKLISHMLKFGMPFEHISPRQKHVEETQMSRNAEESLLATLSACAQFTNKISKIEWKNEKSAGEWLSKLHGQSDAESFIFAYSCLNNLDFSKMVLCFRDLCNANLRQSNLQEANLTRSYLGQVDLREADLRKINLSEAFLSGAVLSGVDLRGADFGGTNLQGADLSNANLSEVDLTGAKLAGAGLEGADLRGANLSEMDLSEVTLTRAKLAGADLSGSDLTKADFRDVDIFCARLQGAIVQKNDLNESDLHKAIEMGVILKESVEKEDVEE